MKTENRNKCTLTDCAKNKTRLSPNGLFSQQKSSEVITQVEHDTHTNTHTQKAAKTKQYKDISKTYHGSSGQQRTNVTLDILLCFPHPLTINLIMIYCILLNKL